jgi:hypothetical protein
VRAGGGSFPGWDDPHEPNLPSLSLDARHQEHDPPRPSGSTTTYSHLLRRVNADGSLQVLDATTGLERTMRLAVLAVSGQLTLVAVGDPSAGRDRRARGIEV